MSQPYFGSLQTPGGQERPQPASARTRTSSQDFDESSPPSMGWKPILSPCLSCVKAWAPRWQGWDDFRYWAPRSPRWSWAVLRWTLPVIVKTYKYIYILLLLFCLGFFGCTARGILVPRPGFEPACPAVEAWSLNHWTAREVPKIHILYFIYKIYFIYLNKYIYIL